MSQYEILQSQEQNTENVRLGTPEIVHIPQKHYQSHLNITNSRLEDAGEYRCEVSNWQGKTESSSSYISVHGK